MLIKSNTIKIGETMLHILFVNWVSNKKRKLALHIFRYVWKANGNYAAGYHPGFPNVS